MSWLRRRPMAVPSIVWPRHPEREPVNPPIIGRAVLAMHNHQTGMPFPRSLACVAFLMCCLPATACDLCAIYGANDARGESSQGPLLTVAELFVPSHTL